VEVGITAASDVDPVGSAKIALHYLPLAARGVVFPSLLALAIVNIASSVSLVMISVPVQLVFPTRVLFRNIES